MNYRTRYWVGSFAFFWVGALCCPAQVLDKHALSGKYFFRQVLVSGSTTSSLLGTITFDGAGGYTFVSGQSQGSRSYSVDPAGFVTMDDPLVSGASLNARFSTRALLGASTENSQGAFDLLVALPAPAGAASLAGPYWTVTLDAAVPRNTFFSLQTSGPGQFADLNVAGHAATLNAGAPATQTITGATYTLGGDGSGTLNFPPGGSLLSGSQTFFVSRDGSLILGGTPGGADILLGVQAGASSLVGRFWGAGLRLEPGALSNYAGAANAFGSTTVVWTRRLHASAINGALDFTGVHDWTLAADGSGSAELAQVAVGAGGDALVGSAISAEDPGAYEVYLATRMPGVSGSGVFLNPQGVLNAASSAPAGNPIAPGEFIALYGSGLATATNTYKPPYPAGANGITVLIDNRPAPLVFAGPTQINVMVPYATSGPTATVMVQSGGKNSNTLTVPVAATAPGAFSLDESGTGGAAVLHADYTQVTPDHPASRGETVLLFMTGLGAVNPPVGDGAIPGANPLSQVTAPVAVLIAGEAVKPVFQGLAPGYPGLYQVNVTIPLDVVASGSVPLSIQTPNAFHDQVEIPLSQ